MDQACGARPHDDVGLRSGCAWMCEALSRSRCHLIGPAADSARASGETVRQDVRQERYFCGDVIVRRCNKSWPAWRDR